MKQEILAARDVGPNSKQMTHARALSIWQEERTADGNYWCGYTVLEQGFKQLIRKLDPEKQKVENTFIFIVWQYCAGCWQVARLSYCSYC